MSQHRVHTESFNILNQQKYRVFHNFTFWNWIYNHNFITKYVLKTNNTKIKIFDSSILDPAFLKCLLYEFSFGYSITLHTGVAYYANAYIPYVELEGEGERGLSPLLKKLGKFFRFFITNVIKLEK